MPSSLLTIAEARARVLAAVVPLPRETVAVADALGRTLAEAVRAAGDAPPFACSAMDGYAVVAGPKGRTLRLLGDESRAGTPSAGAVSAGTAMRISTGAAAPAGTEAVIRQEDVVLPGDGTLLTRAPVRAGENVRGAGEDMRGGTVVLRPGTRVGPAELGAAVAAGTGSLVVAAQPRVAVLATGDELVEAGRPLGPGQIHNSNGPMLAGLAHRAGAVPVLSDRLVDDPAATAAGLAAALEAADVVVVAGGVSVGPHDHVKPALAELGVSERFWRVALQPGKPTWFGTRENRLVFGLPGNPVSAYVTFTLFAAPAIASLQGAAPAGDERTARLAHAVRRNPDREQALRVRLRWESGEPLAEANGPQGSHIVTSLVGADALAVIPRGDGELAAGATVALISL